MAQGGQRNSASSIAAPAADGRGATGLTMDGLALNITPRAFDLFQILFGCTAAKRRLVMRHYSNQHRVLEVGCATGNIAVAFLGRDVNYTGVDIDGAAVDFAARKFRRHAGFAFLRGEIQQQRFSRPFDFIVLSGVLHHVDDATALAMLECSGGLLAPAGTLLVSDPIEPRPEDSRLAKMYRKHLERGRHLRSVDELARLLAKARGLRVVRLECHGLAPFPIGSRPIVARFAVFRLQPHVPCSGAIGRRHAGPLSA